MLEQAGEAGGWGGVGEKKRGRNPEQFMFGISVIESHSYIKVRKL